MLAFISRIIMKLGGWRISQSIPEDIKKCVIVVAPHTSNLDYFWGRLGFFVIRVRVKFLIKKEAFFWPVGGIVKAWGGIPVDRQKNNRLVDFVAGLFGQHDSLYVVVTPEGTRSRVEHWRRGFYYIALKAKVPLALAYLDYENKEVGVGRMFEPTGDYKADLAVIQDFYRDKVPRHPENFNLAAKD
jgi:1-acyl-sn-glycerol-3-phosphate acyltransferase